MFGVAEEGSFAAPSERQLPPYGDTFPYLPAVFALDFLTALQAASRLESVNLAALCLLGSTGFQALLGLLLRRRPSTRKLGRALVFGGGVLFFPLLGYFGLIALMMGVFLDLYAFGGCACFLLGMLVVLGLTVRFFPYRPQGSRR